MPELLIILLILAVFFGAGKLPEVMGALGESSKHFREGVQDAEDEAAAKERDDGSPAA